ncbi:hypothetical protein FS749_001093 [Ceratobasidium sp. UAMH 11750]|nr:hypothetical protein FS749_001093 [Ceratobasidium sp. UAMH 11750]
MKVVWKMGVARSGAEDALANHNGNPVVFLAIGLIQANNFYLTPHCGFDPGRVLASKGLVRALEESKATVMLGTVPLIANKFKLYKENLRALFPGVMPLLDQSGMMVKHGEHSFFKINHQMFLLHKGMLPDDVTMTAATGGIEAPDTELIPAFQITNWPVPKTCVHLCNAIVKTHQVNPIPVFMNGNKHPIIPANYACFLRGTIAQVHFTVSHKTLRCKIPSLFFSATLDKIVVLQTHTPADLAPSKAHLASCFLMHPPTNEDEAAAKPGPSKANKQRHV